MAGAEPHHTQTKNGALGGAGKGPWEGGFTPGQKGAQTDQMAGDPQDATPGKTSGSLSHSPWHHFHPQSCFLQGR